MSFISHKHSGDPVPFGVPFKAVVGFALVAIVVTGAVVGLLDSHLGSEALLLIGMVGAIVGGVFARLAPSVIPTNEDDLYLLTMLLMCGYMVAAYFIAWALSHQIKDPCKLLSEYSARERLLVLRFWRLESLFQRFGFDWA